MNRILWQLNQLTWPLVEKMFAFNIRHMKDNAHWAGYTERMAENNKMRHESELFRLEEMVGHPVICLSNEWDNPVIGFAKRVDLITKSQNPILVVHDELTQQDVMCMGKTWYFTQQRFEVLMKLTPFEACSLVYESGDEEFIKTKSGVRQASEVIIEKLKAQQFFERIKVKSY